MRTIVQRTCLLAATAFWCHGQTFEVATIKIVNTGGQEKRGGTNVEARPGNVTMRNAGMGTIIMWAYKISPYQVTNGQALGGGDFYDIVAKAAGPATTDEMRLMMQALLAERFKMKTHRETKEQSAYALVEAKGGHKMKETDAKDGLGVLPVQGGKMALNGQSATLDQLAMFLSGPLRTPVVDMTGLKGRYDFDFDLTNFVGPGANPGEKEAPPDPVAILQMALP
jgi:uncharacterized protein (TIGR03435 family)